MIHIILAILKIVGIFLAVLLGLLLAVVLTILFLPIRYRIQAQKYGTLQESEAEASVRWLFGIIKLKAIYKKNHLSCILQIFRKKRNLIGEDSEREAARTENSEKESEQSSKSEDKARRRKKTEKPEKQRDRSVEEPKEENEDLKAENKELPEKTPVPVSQKEQEETRQDQQHPPGRIRRWISKIRDRIKNVVKQIKETFSSVVRSKEKLERYLTFLQSDLSKEVYHILKGHVCYLLHHIRPRKITGHIHYGFEDPAQTGQLTGILYLILPANCGRLNLEPDFEKQICEGEILLCGHIRICHLVKTGIKIFFDKKLKLYWKRFKRLRRA